MPKYKRHFIQGVRTKETQELNNPIGGELKICPKSIANAVQQSTRQTKS
jgi:hypothetical protein